MQEITVWVWLGLLVGACGLTVSATLWILGVKRREMTASPSFASAEIRDPLFLFDGDTLLDASKAGHALLKRAPSGEGWSALHSALVGRFPGFPSDPETIREENTISIKAADTKFSGEVLAEWIDGVTRVHMRMLGPVEKSDLIDPHRLQAAEAELDSLRVAMDAAPYPIWQMDDRGRVSWHNAAYAALHRRVRKTDVDSMTPLFDLGGKNRMLGSRTRLSVALDEGDSALWYDVLSVPHEGFGMYYAVDVNAVVSAEIAQRNFVQTLAKTFAQLSIGLAIFDRNRQLALFNPALIDLTNLPADFLSARPNLLSFFDRLRDNRMMPEPKNYGSWRQQMAALVAAATDGKYMETWSLPSGSIYKVSGRPHPDGAVAFLFEDITADVTLTRRFKSELELWQSLLDKIKDPVAVFQPDGALAITNKAYRQFWGVDPESSFADISINDAIGHWQSKSERNTFFADIRDFVLNPQKRKKWSAPLPLNDGGSLQCDVCSVEGGSTMVRFSPLAEIKVAEQLLKAPQLQRSS